MINWFRLDYFVVCSVWARLRSCLATILKGKLGVFSCEDCNWFIGLSFKCSITDFTWDVFWFSFGPYCVGSDFILFAWIWSVLNGFFCSECDMVLFSLFAGLYWSVYLFWMWYTDLLIAYWDWFVYTANQDWFVYTDLFILIWSILVFCLHCTTCSFDVCNLMIWFWIFGFSLYYNVVCIQILCDTCFSGAIKGK